MHCALKTHALLVLAVCSACGVVDSPPLRLGREPLDAGSTSDTAPSIPVQASAAAGAGAAFNNPGLAPVGDAGAQQMGCELGSAASIASDSDLDLFGQITYFAGGHELPAGKYRVTYLDGCVKYDGFWDWSVNASADNAFWLVSTDTKDRIVVAPGTVGLSAALGGAYAKFEDCVKASLAVPPVDFDFRGGKLGIWLNDSLYTDNLAGENGRNPKWSLRRLDVCTPDLIHLL